MNIHYISRYLKLCKYFKNLDRKLGVKEKHHIVPRSISKELKYNEDNIVELTLREHYIIHWILARANVKNMIFAFHKLVYSRSHNFKINSRIYEELKIKAGKRSSEILSGRKFSEEHKLKLSKAAQGRKLSEETKRKIGEASKNIIRTKESYERAIETRKKNGFNINYTTKGSIGAKRISKANSNRVNIHKDNIEKHVKKDELDKYLNDGWLLGCKLTNKKRSRITINNGINNKIIRKDELEKYLNLGYVIGRKPGHRHSEETKRKIGDSKRKYLLNHPEEKLKQIETMNKAKLMKVGG